MLDEITIHDSEFESPAWHKAALAETKSRYESGQEKLIDWEEAKELLRKQCKL
jgi:hypothetical protein